MFKRWVIAGAVGLLLAIVAIPLTQQSWRWTGSSGGATCDPNGKQADLEFTLKDMNGADVNLASFKGQAILLNFWATWCPPCKYEIPMFTELYAKYKDEGFVVLGFSVDDPPELLQSFAKEMNMNYPVLVGLGRDDVQAAFGNVWALPTTFLIARDGRLCKKLMGVATKEHFEKEIKGIL